MSFREKCLSTGEKLMKNMETATVKEKVIAIIGIALIMPLWVLMCLAYAVNTIFGFILAIASNAWIYAYLSLLMHDLPKFSWFLLHASRWEKDNGLSY